ncbi:MAG: hypothetical protein AB7T20_08335 [Steroidobacteraceae bacterium]
MPGRMLAALVAIAFGSWMALAGAVLAGATEPAAQDEGEAQEPEFKPPPGYKSRTRGDKVVYCRKELVEGTRFTQEKCYDKLRLKEIESLMDQRRRICAACV